jgi:hypothetical protein
MTVVDGGGECDLCVHGDVAVGELASDYVGVLGECYEDGWRDAHVVGYAGVVVARGECVRTNLREQRKGDEEGMETYIMIGIGL